MQAAIRTENLTRRFGDLTAVSNVNLVELTYRREAEMETSNA